MSRQHAPAPVRHGHLGGDDTGQIAIAHVQSGEQLRRAAPPQAVTWRGTRTALIGTRGATTGPTLPAKRGP
jgi:hypothetical protein